VQDVDWVPFVAYGKLAEIAVKYLDKGSHVSIESRLKPWKIEKNGQTRYGLNVVATDILFLDAKDQAPAPEQVADPAGQVDQQITDEDIPF
jgi:single-strand DNA-binding protein